MTTQTISNTATTAQPTSLLPETNAKSFFASFGGDVTRLQAVQTIFSKTTFEKTRVVLLSGFSTSDVEKMQCRQALLSSLIGEDESNVVLVENFANGVMVDYSCLPALAKITKPIIALGWDDVGAIKKFPTRGDLLSEAQFKFYESCRHQSLLTSIFQSQIYGRVFVIAGARQITDSLLRSLSCFNVAVIKF